MTASGASSATVPLLYVGDDNYNDSYRGFLSFDLGALPSTLTSISSATLSVYQEWVENKPYSALIGSDGGLRAESVSYGADLTAAAFDTPTFLVKRCIGKVCLTQPASVILSSDSAAGRKAADVTSMVRDDWTNRTARGSRSQFRLRFAIDTNLDSIRDMAAFWSGEASSVMPTLLVSYLYP